VVQDKQLAEFKAKNKDKAKTIAHGLQGMSGIEDGQ
jgi:hypothetical protein